MSMQYGRKRALKIFQSCENIFIGDAFCFGFVIDGE